MSEMLCYIRQMNFSTLKVFSSNEEKQGKKKKNQQNQTRKYQMIAMKRPEIFYWRWPLYIGCLGSPTAADMLTFILKSKVL